MNKLEIMNQKLITILQNSDIALGTEPVFLVCRGCEKVIRTIQQDQKYLGSIYPQIEKQVPEPVLEKRIFAPKQFDPQFTREIWVASDCFFCRFCVPNKFDPDYKKFYAYCLSGGRFYFVADMKGKKAQEKYLMK